MSEQLGEQSQSRSSACIADSRSLRYALNSSRFASSRTHPKVPQFRRWSQALMIPRVLKPLSLLNQFWYILACEIQMFSYKVLEIEHQLLSFLWSSPYLVTRIAYISSANSQTSSSGREVGLLRGVSGRSEIALIWSYWVPRQVANGSALSLDFHCTSVPGRALTLKGAAAKTAADRGLKSGAYLSC